MEQTKKVLEVRNLTKVFGNKQAVKFTAVDHIHFSLYQGECLGLIGESGSGKSTTVSMITRLLDATEGQILMNGNDITHLKGRKLREVYKEIQMVFQMPTESFDPRCTLGDGIVESLRNQGLSKKDAREEGVRMLKRCGLSGEYFGRYPHEVSGGQCQRAAIARALAIHPKILIFDEATSALDVTIQKEIIDLLRELKQSDQELSILFICHDIALVQQICDRVLVMYQGSIVEEGMVDEVIRNPKAAYTMRLMESVL